MGNVSCCRKEGLGKQRDQAGALPSAEGEEGRKHLENGQEAGSGRGGGGVGEGGTTGRGRREEGQGGRRNCWRKALESREESREESRGGRLEWQLPGPQERLSLCHCP